jgi:hypothetical protein
MKMALGFAAVILLGAVPTHAQGASSSRSGGGGGGSNGGGGLSGSASFTTLGWVPPATLVSTTVSGSDATYVPSTFVTFAEAVAQGNIDLKKQGKTVVEAAAESRSATESKITVDQTLGGNIRYAKN